MSTLRRLFFDIEVSPNIGFFWQPGYRVSIPAENIIKERAIICICYKWSDQKKIYSLKWSKGNDKKLLQDFLKVADQADELVGHNGDRFDLPWIRTRCLFHKISMMPTYTTIDTLKAARSGFRLNSNRLDYISKFLGGDGKIKTSFDLWRRITLDNCSKSLAEMVKYCKKDVLELEAVFERMDPYIKHKSSVTENKVDCPKCGSGDLRVKSYKITAQGTKYANMQCYNCGKYHKVNTKHVANK